MIINVQHPGQILLEGFLEPYGLSAYRVAMDIGVPTNRITSIINEERSITPETGLLLGRYFQLSDDLWSNLQTQYDIEHAKERFAKFLEFMPVFERRPANHDFWQE